MEEIFNRIATMIEVETGYSKKKISRNTRLHQDIRIDGDDAEEFLCKYSGLFAIDMNDFEFYRYFNSEGFNLISILTSIFGFGNKRKLEPITVGMLEQSALLHKWNS